MATQTRNTRWHPLITRKMRLLSECVSECVRTQAQRHADTQTHRHTHTLSHVPAHAYTALSEGPTVPAS